MTIVHSYDDTEDILQETATILWEKFDQYQEGTSFAAWAIAIARNKTLQYIKKNRTPRMIFDDAFYNEISEYSRQNIDDVTDREIALNDCIERLSEGSRKLLSMRYKDNVPIKKMSDLTGRTANALYQNFWKIMQALRTCVQSHLDSKGI